MLRSSDAIATKAEEVIDLIMADRKRCAWPADLNCFICRSRRRVGSWEFSALLFSPLCWRCWA